MGNNKHACIYLFWSAPQHMSSLWQKWSMWKQVETIKVGTFHPLKGGNSSVMKRRKFRFKRSICFYFLRSTWAPYCSHKPPKKPRAQSVSSSHSVYFKEEINVRVNLRWEATKEQVDNPVLSLRSCENFKCYLESNFGLPPCRWWKIISKHEGNVWI